MAPGFRKGRLIKWKDDRGFGFIQPADGSREVFLHISEVKDAMRRPVVGDAIYYLIAQQDGKVRAYDAFIVGARLKPTSLPSTAPQAQSQASSGYKAKFKTTFLAPFPVAEALGLSIFPLVGAVHFTIKTGNPIPLFLYPVMGCIAFAQYARDKTSAQQGAWRTSEQTLILCDLACGWVGGFIAQRRLRHKISKPSYQLAFQIVIVMHYVFWLCWLALGKSIGLWT
jgi:uncharacterized membrane protein YsdA (DUF1294 family)/cold shock CspA family protein